MIAELIGHRLFAPVASFVVASLLLVIAIMGFTIHGLNTGITKAESQRDKAIEDKGRCEANVASQKVSIEKANAEYGKLSAESQAKLTTAAAKLETARKSRATAEANALELLRRPPVGIDACARMESADRMVLEALQ